MHGLFIDRKRQKSQVSVVYFFVFIRRQTINTVICAVMIYKTIFTYFSSNEIIYVKFLKIFFGKFEII